MSTIKDGSISVASRDQERETASAATSPADIVMELITGALKHTPEFSLLLETEQACQNEHPKPPVDTQDFYSVRRVIEWQEQQNANSVSKCGNNRETSLPGSNFIAICDTGAAALSIPYNYAISEGSSSEQLSPARSPLPKPVAPDSRQSIELQSAIKAANVPESGMRIKIVHPELGKIWIQLQQRQASLQLNVVTASSSCAQLIESVSQPLLNRLRNLGLRVNEIKVLQLRKQEKKETRRNRNQSFDMEA